MVARFNIINSGPLIKQSLWIKCWGRNMSSFLSHEGWGWGKGASGTFGTGAGCGATWHRLSNWRASPGLVPSTYLVSVAYLCSFAGCPQHLVTYCPWGQVTCICFHVSAVLSAPGSPKLTCSFSCSPTLFLAGSREAEGKALYFLKDPVQLEPDSQSPGISLAFLRVMPLLVGRALT